MPASQTTMFSVLFVQNFHTCTLPPHTQVLPGPSWYEVYRNVSITDNDVMGMASHPVRLLPLAMTALASKSAAATRLVELLLLRGVPLEAEWPDTGETALSMAVKLNDAQVGRLRMHF